jgi:hypothetical protein
MPKYRSQVWVRNFFDQLQSAELVEAIVRNQGIGVSGKPPSGRCTCG